MLLILLSASAVLLILSVPSLALLSDAEDNSKRVLKLNKVKLLLYTESVVDDRVLAGICECPRIKKPKDGRWSSSTQGDGVSRKTPGGRQRETTSLTISS